MPERAWPGWWHWEIVLSYHALERMTQRGFTEIDLRSMLEHATGYHPEPEGKWAIEARWRRQNWEIIVQPDRLSEELVVITAYTIDRG